MSNPQPPTIDRINVEPAILFGLSSSEAYWVIVFSIAVFWPVALMAAPFGLVWAVLIGFGGPVGAVYVAAQKMAVIKRDRPDMYYLHLFRAWLAHRHLRKSRFIAYSGDWDLGRSLPQGEAK